jgi:hypothetical protein
VPEPGMPVPTTSYQLPIITSLLPALRGVNPATDYTTAGGTRLVVSGTSFGPPGVDIRMLFGSVWDSCLQSKAGCMYVQAPPMFRVPMCSGTLCPPQGVCCVLLMCGQHSGDGLVGRGPSCAKEILMSAHFCVVCVSMCPGTSPKWPVTTASRAWSS